MNFRQIIASAVFLTAFTCSAGAQELNTGFFLDNYAFSHRINPALQASRGDVSGYVGLGADNVNVAAHTNVGLENFLFPSEDGSLIIGLDDRVSEQDFLSGLSPVNNVRIGLNENVFSIGGRGKRGTVFNIEANIKSNNALNVSKDLFELLKKGGNISNVRFSDFSFSSNNYLEAALGLGRKCGNLSIGFKVKALVGVAAADAALNELSIREEDGEFQGEGLGHIRIAANFLDYLDGDGHFKSPALGKIGHSGIGVAFDLGLAYELDNLEMSAYVGDIGGLTWNYDTDGVLECSYLDELDIMVKDRTSSSELDMLPLKVNAGLRYKLGRTFSLGAIASANTGKQKFYEARAGIACTAGSVLSVAASGGVNSFGPVYGAALNLCLGPVNLFAGMDQVITRFTPQWIPIGKVNTNASLGLLIAW